MGYRRIVLLLVYLGVIPGVLLSAIGVFLLLIGEALNLLAGILVLTFTGTLVTGVILVWMFVRRERNLSELQADFVSKVSHELRTPLTSIRMFTETLKLRRGDAVTEERCIEALDRESTRLQALIDRLLDWGRMESGMRTLTLATHEVKDIVMEAINAFEPTRTHRDVDLHVDIADDLPPLVCDRAAVVDALVNLLSNAYKYGGSPREIHVSAAVSDGRLRLQVRDNGLGIARVEHKRIFLKFYRVDDKLTRKQDGSGLGLAIVQYVMRAHSGKVELDSAPGKGSAFTLVLPLKRPVTDALLPDSPTALAEDGEEGLRLARRGADLVVLDVMLPKLNGFEVVKTLRLEGNSIPVIMLSARGAEMDKVMGLELGAEDYITKPFGLAELLARVKAVLRRDAIARKSEAVLRAGGLAIDTGAREVKIDGQPVELTATEFDVLHCLAQADGKVLSREQIQSRVWGPTHHGTPRTIDNFILQLRTKLERDPQNPQHILTVRGVGYRLLTGNKTC